MSPISRNLQAVKARIVAAARNASRDPDTIRLLAVSKTFGAEAVIEAADAGQLAFGENYLQEALEKIERTRQLRPDLALEWHFIGPIQSNKTRQIAAGFDWVHSVDRLKIAERLSVQRPEAMPELNVCLQVNISGEASKSGVEPHQAYELAAAIAKLPRLRLRGLMAVPEPETDFDKQRVPFRQLRELAENLRRDLPQIDTLSIGMSADLEAAIAEGATIVRIGTAIFGARPPH